MNQAMNKGYSPSTLKFFIRHMTGAARVQKQREQKISGFESQIAMLKRSAMAPKPSKQRIETGFEDLGRKIKEVINEERVLVINQQKEEKVIDELKERINLLEEKVYGLGHVHSMAAHEHMKRIEEMSSRIKELTSGVVARKAPPKERVKHEPHLVRETKRDMDPKKKEDSIRQLELMIKEAEKRHKELSRKNIPKEHLDRLKRTIESHKGRLKGLKA